MAKKKSKSQKPKIDEIGQKRLKALWKVERALKFRFNNRILLDQSLTHPSFAHEQGGKHFGHYEQLEFVGDAVIDLAVGDMLFRAYPLEGEGYLTRARADLVNQNKLAEIAASLDLGDGMRLGKGEMRTNGQTKPSILAAVFEAVVGAMYLDSGYERSFKVIHRLFKPFIKDSDVGVRDARSQLQEWTQKHYRVVPEYHVVEYGPGHRRVFKVAVYLKGKLMAVGEGPSKKDANRQAAQNALDSIEKGDWDNDDCHLMLEELSYERYFPPSKRKER